LRNLG